MYLATTDLIAVVIALSTSITLIITTALANARITKSRNEWRKAYYNYKFATEAEAMNKPYCWDSESQSWQYVKAGN